MTGIPTSRQTEREARRLGISLPALAENGHEEITIDGAEEVEVGGLLRKKIIGSASEQLIIDFQESKLVDLLGAHGSVAVEVLPFATNATARRQQSLAVSLVRRARRRAHIPLFEPSSRS